MHPSGSTEWVTGLEELSVGHYFGLEGHGTLRSVDFFDFGSH